jgi:non-specific serine/threonine protein kinase
MQYILLLSGHFEYRKSDCRKAKELYLTALEKAQAIGTKQAIAASLECLAWVACAQLDLVRAVQLWGATAGVQEAYGCPLPPFFKVTHDLLDAEIRAKLGKERFSELFTQGNGLPLEQAIALGFEEKES